MFFEIVGLGPETNEMVEGIENKISNCTILVSDGKTPYETFCKKHNIVNEMVKSGTYVNEHGYNLNTINELHREIELELERRYGVSINTSSGISRYVFT